MEALLPKADTDFARAGYIRVFQDVRGKYGSEGAFELTRPPRGPLNATDTDETTDAWDTIDWLVRNVPSPTARSACLAHPPTAPRW
jgi:predicted acyl esterase